jgi:hypothetical protein
MPMDAYLFVFRFMNILNVYKESYQNSINNDIFVYLYSVIKCIIQQTTEEN